MIVLLVDPGQNLVFAPMLVVELETLAHSSAISNAPAHVISTPTWEKLVVLNQI